MVLVKIMLALFIGMLTDSLHAREPRISTKQHQPWTPYENWTTKEGAGGVELIVVQWIRLTEIQWGIDKTTKKKIIICARIVEDHDPDK